MWQQMYTAFTTYEGLYIFYVVPIIYFLAIVCTVISSRRTLHKRVRSLDLIAALAMALIALDFIYYLYLFSTKTGKLLPPGYLFIKYSVGFFLWMLILWYSYEGYFTPHVAGRYFKSRCMKLVWVCVGSLALAGVGIVMSS